MLKRFAIVVLSILFCLSVSSLAFGQKVEAMEDTQKSEFVVKDVLVPSPAALIMAMNKVGNVNWDKAASYNSKSDYNNNYLRALNLGIRGADGFVAIQAKNKKQFQEMIKIIVHIGEELGVSEVILAEGGKFERLVNENKWREILSELDQLRNTIENEMISQDDQDLAVLLSAGAWIEGLRAATEILSSSYSKKSSAIIYQPMLIKYFMKRFEGLASQAKANPVIQKISKKLPQIENLVNVGYKKSIPKENIVSINKITSNLVTSIERGE